MARRGDEAQAEALQVVERVVECVDFQFAAVAGAGVDLADRQAAAEPALRRAVEVGARVASGAGSVTGERRPWRGSSACRRALRGAKRRGNPPFARNRGLLRRFAPRNDSLRASQVVPRVGTVERLVAQREVGDDVALDRRFQQRPLEPRCIAQMAAIDAPRRIDAQPHQHVAAERLGQRDALARTASARSRRAPRLRADRSASARSATGSDRSP